MQCSRAKFVSEGSWAVHYCNSGCCLKKQITLCPLPNPIPRPLWSGLSSARHLQDCTHSSGSAWAVWGAQYPNGVLMASDVLCRALLERTTTCLPYCKPSSANTMLKPDQELVVNWEMEESVEIKQWTWEVKNSAALIFITIFVVTLGLLIGCVHLQLH